MKRIIINNNYKFSSATCIKKKIEFFTNWYSPYEYVITTHEC